MMLSLYIRAELDVILSSTVELGLGFLVFSVAVYEWKGVEVHAALTAACTLHVEQQSDVKSLYPG